MYTVSILPSNPNSVWENGVRKHWNAFVFDNSINMYPIGYQLPLSIKIKDIYNNVIIKYNLINSWEQLRLYDIGTNFKYDINNMSVTSTTTTVYTHAYYRGFS